MSGAYQKITQAISVLREISPGSGAYLNEVSFDLKSIMILESDNDSSDRPTYTNRISRTLSMARTMNVCSASRTSGTHMGCYTEQLLLVGTGGTKMRMAGSVE